MTPRAFKMKIAEIIPQKLEEIRRFRLEPATADHSEVQAFIPGQFVQIRTGPDESTYFAIASGPGDCPFLEFLIKRGKGVAGRMFDLEIGSEIEVTAPQGKGFPIDAYPGQNLLLVGVGTGIAPLRSVIRTALGKPKRFGAISFVYGALTPDHLCYPDDIRDWDRQGIRTHLIVTNFGESAWTGPSGFVQDLLLKIRPSPVNTVAMLVGMREMIEQNTHLLLELGFPRDKILLNF